MRVLVIAALFLISTASVLAGGKVQVRTEDSQIFKEVDDDADGLIEPHEIAKVRRSARRTPPCPTLVAHATHPPSIYCKTVHQGKHFRKRL
jgi:hypothetical protein